MKTNSVSVCIAVYNGKKYLSLQIASILRNLDDDDEVVVVDDCSSDDSVDVIRSFKDVRIKIFHNEANIGVNATFDRALRLATRDALLMADQDDLWTDGRREVLSRPLLQGRAIAVSGNVEYIDGGGGSINTSAPMLHSGDSSRSLRNLWKIFCGTAPYFGCAMGIRREFLKVVSPIPQFVESHDLWIAIAANLASQNCHVDDVVLKRRIHGANVSTPKRPLANKIWSRLVFAASIPILQQRIRRYRRLSDC